MASSDTAVKTYRGNVVENSHVAHVAVVDATGRLLYKTGNPHRMTLVRSAAKPAQALAVMETGALERYGFDEQDLALMCASHSSEPHHVQRAQAMLAKVGAQESDLRCGGHPPSSEAVRRAWIKSDFEPTPVCNNCSGKHVGMLAGARALGAPLADYHLPHHPVQARVRRAVAEVCNLAENEVGWSIDGCNLPTPAVPLDRLAVMFVALAHCKDKVDSRDRAAERGHVDSRTVNLARIFNAMTGSPLLVAGTGRFCTELMSAYAGEVVGKVGADACYGVGVRESEATRRLGAQGAIGISAKIEGGSTDALYMLLPELLERLDIGTPEQRSQLNRFHQPEFLNTWNVNIGHVEFPFELVKA